jgi:hypothetical protein
MALVATVGGRPVGYCVSLPIETYGKLNDLLPQFGVDPATTENLAELGVDTSVRRQGDCLGTVGEGSGRRQWLQADQEDEVRVTPSQPDAP